MAVQQLFFVRWCFLYLFKTAHSILTKFPCRLFFMHFVKVLEVHPYRSINTVNAWKKSCFILSQRPDIHMIDNLSIALHTFTRPMLTSLSEDEMLLLRHVNWSTNFWDLSVRVEVSPSCLKLMGFTLKMQETVDIPQKLWQTQTTQMILRFL